ncbi:MAG: hypothetical protein GC181_09285 [Bacteroidetes bacterium]|nr:hypothetical protein [Bacteroidota bacterium]
MKYSIFICLIIAMAGLSCSSSKKSIHKQTAPLIGKHLMVYSVNYDKMTGEIQKDSAYLFIEDAKFKSYHGMDVWGTFHFSGDKVVYNRPSGQEIQKTELERPGSAFSLLMRKFNNPGFFWKCQKCTSTSNNFQWKLYDRLNLAHVKSSCSIDSGEVCPLVTEIFSLKRFDAYDSTIFNIKILEDKPSDSFFTSRIIRTPVPVSNMLTFTLHDSLNFFEDLESLTSLELRPGKKVVIYSFIGCAGCSIVKNLLMESVEKGEVDPKDIIVVNVNNGRDELLNYINKKQYPFLYYRYKEPINITGNSFPAIVGYNENGIKEWVLHGGSSGRRNEIVKYLRE